MHAGLLRLHRRVFSAMAEAVCAWPKALIAGNLMLCLVMCCGLWRAELGDDFRHGYVIGTRSLHEHTVYANFFNFTATPYMVFITARAKDHGSMLRPAHLTAFRERLQLLRQLSINRLDDGTRFTFDRVIKFSALPMFELLEESILFNNTEVVLDYPVTTVFGKSVSMGTVMYGIAKDEEQNGQLNLNVWLLNYWMVMQRSGANKECELLELAWQEYGSAPSELLDFDVFGDEMINQQVILGAYGSAPYFLIGFAVMIVFVIISVRRVKQGPLGTVLLTIVSVFGPLLAAGAALGVISAMDYKLNSMMCVTPFLLLGIGVDDSFLLLHCWRRRRISSSRSRMIATLCEMGPSISVTSFTNIIAFLIGATVSPAQISLFCTATAFAFFIAWYLQMFLSAPVLLLSTKPIYFVDTDLGNKSNRQEPSSTSSVTRKKGGQCYYDRYAEWITQCSTKCLVFLTLLILWCISAIGIYNMKPDFSPQKTFGAKSAMVESLKILEKMHDKHEIVLLFVNNLPLLENTNDAEKFRHSFDQLQTSEHICPGSRLWIDDYDQFYGTMAVAIDENSTTRYFDLLPEFLEFNPYISELVHYNTGTNGTVTVDSMAIELCVHWASSWSARAHLRADLRHRADAVNGSASLYSYDSAILDLIMTTSRMTIQSTLTTIGCMGLVCLLFIPNLWAIVACLFSMFSIAFVVTGMLSWWGCDLDVIAMVVIIVTVGLTLDYNSHISFHFFAHAEPDVQQRLRTTLAAVAFPMFQAASTTVLCVLPLFFYDVYMFSTFVKTILLSTSCGCFHALLVLPIIFQMIVPSSVPSTSASSCSSSA